MGEYKPLITVFIPYYNDKDYIRFSIESVLNQTYKNFELILVNHASTDGTDTIAHSYTDARIKHITMQKNLGAGSGRLIKEMLKVAKGEYIKLFCADDILIENCLETLVNYVKEHSEKDVVFTDSLYVDSNGNSMNVKHSQARAFFKFDYTEKQLLNFYFNSKSILPYPTSFVRTDSLRKIKLNETYIMLFDMYLWTSLIIDGAKFGFLEDVTVKYRISSLQASSNDKRQKALGISHYEYQSFIKIFYKIKDVELLKFLCRYSPHLDKITAENEEYFPFIVAHYSFMRHEDISSYLYLEELISDPQQREIYEEKFNFGIKELRDLYTNTKSSFVQSNRIKELSLFLQFPMLYVKRLFINKYYKNRYTL